MKPYRNILRCIRQNSFIAEFFKKYALFIVRWLKLTEVAKNDIP